MRRWRDVLARVLPVVVLIPLLAVVGGSPANADPIPATNWAPISIGSSLPGASGVMTDATGSVTVGCQQASTSTLFQSFDVSGTKVQDQSRPAGYSGSFCPGDAGNSTVGKDGTVYVAMTSYSGYNPSGQYIQAWKNNSLVWSYTIPCGSNGFPWAMTMGADDNLYVVISQGGGSCYSWQLIGLTPTAQSGTSPAAPTEVMNHRIYAGSVYGQGLAAYNDGLVMYTSGGIQYVPYSGTWPDAVPVSGVQLSYIGSSNRWFEATVDGKVFLPIAANSTQTNNCFWQSGLTGGLLAVTPDNSPSNPPAPITFYGCTKIHELHPTPSGGVAMRYAYSDSTTGWNDVERISTSSWIKDVGSPSFMAHATMAVDLNGDIAVRNNAMPTDSINGSSYIFPEIDFSLYSGATGEIITSAVFSLRGAHDTLDGPSYMWGGGGDIALAKNTVYVTAYPCHFWNSGCDMSQTRLYAFTVPGVDMDYPRGAILKHDEPWKNYVAMGDSFSSGQGVAPFESGTDTAGPPENSCHRSPQAYSRLLGGNPGARLNLTSLVACSGAKTDQINGTWDPNVQPPVNLNEPAQDTALGSSTDVVTISIGGNDIGFADFVTQCLFFDCSNSAANQQFFDNVNNLASKLSGAYDSVLTRAPNATVYVVGYPQLLPDPSLCPNPLDAGVAVLDSEVRLAHGGDAVATAAVYLVGRVGAHLSDAQIQALIDAGQVTFTSAEIATARNLTTALNDKISATVTAKNDARLKFVAATAGYSPFFGHELCTSSPYFNGVDLGHPEYSFHPNQEGQDAYRRLLQSQF